MNIRHHFKERYVQRITGLTDKIAIKQYIGQNDAQLCENIDKMFSFSKFLYRGQIGKENPTCNFYLSDDIILVADGANQNLMTLYRIDFDFPQEVNRAITKGLLKEIEALSVAINETNEGIEEFIAKNNLQIEQVDTEIKALEKQLEIRKQDKKILEETNKMKRNDSEFYRKEYEKYINRLCNSLEYKKAIQEVAE